jgi:hypothetical protein
MSYGQLVDDNEQDAEGFRQGVDAALGLYGDATHALLVEGQTGGDEADHRARYRFGREVFLASLP